MPPLTHNFTALALQLPEMNGDKALPIIMGLLDDAGQMEQPKVIPAAIPLKDSQGTTIALYSMQQSKNIGRRSDFSHFHRLGGRVVPRDEPPLHGVVEISPFPETFDSSVIKQYPWPVSQILWISDSIWISLVKDGEAWRERERFRTKSLHRQFREWVDTPDKPCLEFYEFLHRAVLRWDEVYRPETLARYAASHARSFQPDEQTEEFSAKLSERCGFVIHDKELTITILRATGCLEQLSRLVTGTGESVEAHADWPFSLANAGHAVRMLVDAAMPTFSDDRLVADFCRVFLAELFASKELPEKFDQESMAEAARQVETAFNMLPDGMNEAFSMIDGNAGCGDYLIAAIKTLPEDARACSIVAHEANPVAYQVARLRVECAMKTRKSLDVSVHFRNTYRDGIEKPPSGTCVFVGEVKPHLIKGTSLTITREENQKARYDWGKKLQNQDRAIAGYMEAIASVLQKTKVDTWLLSLRVPAEWAEDMTHAEERKRLFEAGSVVFVDNSGVIEQPVDRRLSRGDVVIVAGDAGKEFKAPPKLYTRVSPHEQTGFSLITGQYASDYLTWPALPDLFLDKPLNGPIERRGMTMIDIDRDRLAERLSEYFGDADPRDLLEKYPVMLTDTKQFNARETWERFRTHGFSPDDITRYEFRPFDARYLYVKDARPLFSEPTTALFSLADAGDSFLVASAGNPRTDMGVPAWFGNMPCDYDFFAGRSGHFPVWIKETVRVGKERRETRIVNISEKMRAHFEQLGFVDLEQSRDTAELLWLHVLAVLNTPAYLKENREALRLGWPRIPVPGFDDGRTGEEAKELLAASADLGRRVAELLAHNAMTPDSPLPEIGQLFVDGRPAAPERMERDTLAIDADWGGRIKGNAVRPRPGTVDMHAFGPDDVRALTAIAGRFGIDDSHWDAVFGEGMVTIWLNRRACWSGVPVKVWEFILGGRQVLPKWLSYREISILGRPLFPEDMQYFGDMIRRLMGLLLLGMELDKLRITLRE